MASPLYAGLSQERLDRIFSKGQAMAAGALSRLVDGEVRVSINELRLVPLWEVARTLGDPDHVVIGVSFKLTGELEGCLSLLLERAGVLALMDLLLKRPVGTTRSMDEIERSAVKETSNILANTYLTALGHEIGLAVMPGAPRFSEAPLGDILESLLLEQSEIAVADRFLLMRNALTASNLTLEGNLVVFLKRASPSALELSERLNRISS
jgi:chemotaxis protein CheC